MLNSPKGCKYTFKSIRDYGNLHDLTALNSVGHVGQSSVPEQFGFDRMASGSNFRSMPERIGADRVF